MGKQHRAFASGKRFSIGERFDLTRRSSGRLDRFWNWLADVLGGTCEAEDANVIA